MSLHIPAGACIPVASASPIHVPPVQRVLKHRGAHKDIPKTILGHPSWGVKDSISNSPVLKHCGAHKDI